MQNDTIRATAYHEAGHCVAACLVRKRFRLATIIPKEGSLGEFVPDKLAKIDIASADVKSCKAWIFIGLAGIIAENEFRNPGKISKMPSFHPDIDIVTKIANKLCWSSKEKEAYLRFMWIRTRNIIERYWQAVQLMANELIKQKTIHYNQALEIIKKAIGCVPQIYFL